MAGLARPGEGTLKDHGRWFMWKRLERLLPTLALVVGLSATLVIGGFQHARANSVWNNERAELERVLLAANGRTAQVIAVQEDFLEELADRVERSGTDQEGASAVVAELGPDIADRSPSLVGALATDETGANADTAAIDERLETILAAAPTAADRIGALIVAADGDLPRLVTLDTLTALIIDDRAPSVALLFETEGFLAGLGSDTAPMTTTAMPFAGAADEEPIVNLGSTVGPHATTTTELLGSVLRLETRTADALASRPSPADRLPSLAVGVLSSVVAFAVVRWLVLSQIRAVRAASRAVAAQRAIDLRFRTSFERSPMGIAEIDPSGRFVEVNPALCREVGLSRDQMLGQPLLSIIHPSDRDQYNRKFHAVATGGTDAARSEHRYQRPDGSVVWVDESLSIVSDPTGDVRRFLLQAQDITTRREATSELARQAFHDALTGLPNRALFLNRLRQALVRLGRSPGYVAVMFIDVDRFKVINDSLGHETGDRFLREIAGRLSKAVRTGDTVARFGGDEFVVLCEAVESPSEAHYIAERMQSALAHHYELGDSKIDGASASIGITICDDKRVSAEDLLRDADAAMYRAKENGRNRVELFDTTLRREVVARMEIEAQLRHALESGDMVMHYQAIVDCETELPAGYEALIRWNHPEKGLLAPSAFLPVAEEAGVMNLIDSFALRTVCNQIAAWSAKHPGFRRMYVSTNWSARQLEQYVALTEQVLAETGIDPRQLVIEVTEGFLLEDSDASMLALSRLKTLGVQVAIDDFGTGYSSLSYLTRLDVDFLKIDRSFVIQLPDPASAAIIRAVADMASRLNMGLIVEGVDSDEQLAFLRGIGRPKLQGYRFSKPRWASEVDESMRMRFSPTASAPAGFITG